MALIQALLGNASSLVDDARLLLEHGRAPRAYALAVLAIEELGKTYPCLQLMLGDTSLTAREFWTGWTLHRDKLDAAWAYHTAFIALLEAIDFAHLSEPPREMGSMKMRGLYVDMDADGIQTPAAVDAGRAEEMVLLAAGAIQHATAVFRPVTPEMLPILAQLGDRLELSLSAAIDENDPEAALATMRGLLQAGQQGDLEAIGEVLNLSSATSDSRPNDPA